MNVFCIVFFLGFHIQKARNQYNRYVGKLNTQIESFPASLIARKFGFEKQNYFTLELATQRGLPEVEFFKISWFPKVNPYWFGSKDP